MKMVKAYKPETNSVCSGQVLHCPYDFEKAKLVVKEMTDQMVLDLVLSKYSCGFIRKKLLRKSICDIIKQNGNVCLLLVYRI